MTMSNYDDYIRDVVRGAIYRNCRPIGTPETVDSAVEEIVRVFRISFDAVKEAARDMADSDWRASLRAIDAQTYPVPGPLLNRAEANVKFARDEEAASVKR